MKAAGYLVMEFCEDYEQALALVTGEALPPGGILDWTNTGPVAMFASRADARAAIDRTEHYRLAYGRDNLPEKKLCRVVPIAAVPNGAVRGASRLAGEASSGEAAPSTVVLERTTA